MKLKKALKPFLTPILKLLKLIVKPFGFDVVNEKSLIDYVLHEYQSYEEYRNTQLFYNQKKINNVWADAKTLDRVVTLVCDGRENRPINGICHGTRNGFEQNYLNSSDCDIYAIGTDISDTALNYKNSVQWDFHDAKDDWVNSFDFVYTNSLDQSWKPKLAVQTWLNQLKPNGILIIEHTEAHGPLCASKMDPFGVRPVAMPYILTEWFNHQISISHTKESKSNSENTAWLFVCRKHVDVVK